MEKRVIYSICFLLLAPDKGLSNVYHIQPIEIHASEDQDAFSRRAQELRRSTTSAEILEPEVRPVQEALNEIPGVVGSTTGSPVISIRGSSNINRVLGLWNGISLNLADPFGMSSLLLPREALQDMDVIRNPTGTAFGSGATGGMLSFTSRVFDRPTTRLQVGSFGTRSLLAATPIIKKTSSQSLQVTAFHEHSDADFSFQVPRLQQSGNRQRNDSSLVRTTLTGSQDLGDGWKVFENFVYAKQAGSTPGSISGTGPGTTSSVSNEGLLAALTVEKVLTERWETSFRTNWTQMKNWNVYESTPASPGSSTSQRYSNSISVRQNEKDGAIEYFVDSNYSEYKTQANNNFVYTRHEPETGALAHINMEGDWTFSPGLRYLPTYGRMIKSASFHQVRPTGNTSDFVFVNYSEGFTAPNMSILFETGAFVEPNPSLQPEESQMTEIGFQHRPALVATKWTEDLAYGLSVYRTTYNNLIVSQPNASSKYQSVNQKNANIYGIEAELGWKYSVLSWIIQYAYTESTDETGNRPVPRVPRNHGSFATTAALGPAVFELKAAYLGPYQLGSTSRTEFEPTTTYDFTVRTLGLSDWSARAGILNIFDQPREWTLGFPEQQRRFFAAVERQF